MWYTLSADERERLRKLSQERDDIIQDRVRSKDPDADRLGDIHDQIAEALPDLLATLDAAEALLERAYGCLSPNGFEGISEDIRRYFDKNPDSHE